MKVCQLFVKRHKGKWGWNGLLFRWHCLKPVQYCVVSDGFGGYKTSLALNLHELSANATESLLGSHPFPHSVYKPEKEYKLIFFNKGKQNYLTERWKLLSLFIIFYLGNFGVLIRYEKVLISNNVNGNKESRRTSDTISIKKFIYFRFIFV